jgi:hypothetical protein
MTFRELYREFAAARKRTVAEASRDVTVAWHTVRLWVEVQSKKKLPSLASQLPKADTKAANRPQQLKAALAIVSEQYGIPLRTRRRPRKG